MSLLEQDIIRKKRINELFEEPKFDAGNNQEYKVKTIKDSTIYVKKTEGYLPGFYYLAF